MKTFITAVAVTAILATSAVAKPQRTKAVRAQPNNAVVQVNSVNNAFTRTPILIPEFDSNFCATAEATNRAHHTDAGAVPGPVGRRWPLSPTQGPR